MTGDSGTLWQRPLLGKLHARKRGRFGASPILTLEELTASRLAPLIRIPVAGDIYGVVRWLGMVSCGWGIRLPIIIPPVHLFLIAPKRSIVLDIDVESRDHLLIRSRDELKSASLPK
jgi:hypothetical protein